jgi:lipopolysaccharide export system permease protein
MRLLDRYLLRELLVPFGYCLIGFLIFWISFNLFNRIDDFHEHGLHVTDVVEYYVVTLPEQLVLVVPVALLLGLLYSLTNHARHHELTAIRAAGVSLWRIAAPYFALGIVLSLALFAMNELLVPGGAERAERILYQNEPRGEFGGRQWKHNLHFRNARAQRSWTIPAYNIDTTEMIRPSVIWELDGGARREIYAERAVFTNGVWAFFGVQETVYEYGGEIVPRRTQSARVELAEFPETPELIKSEIKIASLSSIKAGKRPELSIRDIVNYRQLHPEMTSREWALIGTQLHGRLAAPWTALLVVLIALPFGAPTGRRNVFVGVASSILICFVYFVLLRLGLNLGVGGVLSPWLAAWLPNFLFAAAGLWMTTKVR